MLPPLAQPDPRDEVLLLCGTSALAVLCLLPKRRFLLALVLCVLAAATAVLGVQQRNAARFPDPGPLDALFGPAAGTEVVESLAQCVRGPVGLHVPDPKKSFVFLLGGQLLWQRSEQPGQAPLHIEPLHHVLLHAWVRLSQAKVWPGRFILGVIQGRVRIRQHANGGDAARSGGLRG